MSDHGCASHTGGSCGCSSSHQDHDHDHPHGHDHAHADRHHSRDGHDCCSGDHCGCATQEAELVQIAPQLTSGCGDEACGCKGGVPVFDGVDKRYKGVLWVVIALNAAMFAVEMIAGRLAGSQALQADALDFLGDTLTYGLSLMVIGSSLAVRARAALFKGASLAAMAAWVLGSTLYNTFVLAVPTAEVMGVIGLCALGANLASVALLARYKDGDANVRSVWLCSRNDAIGNVIVMAAALGVWQTDTPWPDLAVAGVMAGLFLSSSLQILKQARGELRTV